MPDEWLSTAQLSDETGVPAGTLRMWESRHDFPSPERLPSGRRRYRREEADTVRQVLALRGDGLSMPAAIRRARALEHKPRSIFAALREARPDLSPLVLRKPAVLALTRAIEDEHLARAQRGLVFGSFQQERYYRQSEARWRELARTAELAIALANFPHERKLQGGVIELPLGATDELIREWTLIVDAPPAAVLSAWERPSPVDTPQRERRFETLWSSEPDVVDTAVHAAVSVLETVDHGVALRVSERLGRPAGASGPELRYAGALSQRAFGYLATQFETEAVRAPR